MRRLKDLALPFVVYLVGALVVPALNGAWQDPDFVPHAVGVLPAAALGVSLVAFSWETVRQCWPSSRRSPPR